MGKIIMIILIITLVYFLFSKRGSSVFKKPIKDKHKEEDKSEQNTMVECAKCQVFLSPDETILKNGQHFCSKECANL